MNKVLQVLIVVACLIFSGCGDNNEAAHSGFTIKGRITNFPDKKIELYELTTKGLRLIDSSLVATDGSFVFEGQLPEKTFCTIGLPNGAVVLVVDSNSTINISVDANSPDQFGVNGSRDSEILRKMLGINNKYMLAVQGLEKKYERFAQQQPTEAESRMMRSDYDSIMASRTRDLQAYALSLENTIVPYFAANFLLPESDFNFIKEIDDKFYGQQARSKYAQQHRKRVDELRKTAPGQVAPDIVLADPFGKIVALSSLRGKVVLVDFWASWCKPCREESPNLVRLYNKYKTSGFDIFSVSLDDNRDQWQKAINDDKLLWTHVSDLQKWNSPVVALYRIDAIPATMLLDKEGRIVARNLRGPALELALENAFR
jgi:peroxiredoxin